MVPEFFSELFLNYLRVCLAKTQKNKKINIVEK
jgi:hypothetical protein